MADMMGNQSSVVSAPVTHRTYSDDGLSWPNRKSDFVGLLVPFLVCACRPPRHPFKAGADGNTPQVLAWAAVGLRLYTRFKIVRAPGWDDFFIGIALVRMFACAALFPPMRLWSLC